MPVGEVKSTTSFVALRDNLKKTAKQPTQSPSKYIVPQARHIKQRRLG